MKTRFSIAVICVAMLTCCGYAQMTNIITVTNQPSSSVSIVPLDPARAASIPQELSGFMQQLPLGSFLLHNKTHTAITAVVAQWSFTKRTGLVEKRKIQCDGYMFPPVRAIVKPNDLSLITPGSCSKGELLSRFGSPSIGSPFTSRINSALLATQADVEKIAVTVDSIIFEDGTIWGPDTQKYYTRIWERHSAAQSFVKDLNDAATRGEDIKTRAKKIREESALKSDRTSALRGHYGALLESSPDPKQTLAALQSREALPEFHHIEEGK
jgi:hypothetical protein